MTLANCELVKRFLKDESGAVTVDWVVLTAAIVGLGIAVIAMVSSGTNSLSLKVQSALSDMEIASAVSELFQANGALSAVFGGEGAFEALLAEAAEYLEENGAEAIQNIVEGSLQVSESAATGDAGEIDVAGAGIQVLEEAGHSVSDDIKAKYQAEHARCLSNGVTCLGAAS